LPSLRGRGKLRVSMALAAKKPATYEDLMAAPAHLVARCSDSNPSP
jgi:hypothetical protein